ncbi:MAG TPA: methyltransferase domain-containing protein, partial [Gemmatimonadales bacterium]|nr:methyltransferase domain-containing protein [Gemmatimonadales bacterium]
MSVVEVAAEEDRYVLGTGKAGEDRLRILHRAYGPGTRRFLGLAGLKPGMRVADIGCGVGQVTVDLAELVGGKGQVVGVDVSRAQLAQAH